MSVCSAGCSDEQATVCEAAQATRSAVLETLSGFPWAHVTCHGLNSLDDPPAGYLLLHDHESRPLTVIDLARLRPRPRGWHSCQLGSQPEPGRLWRMKRSISPQRSRSPTNGMSTEGTVGLRVRLPMGFARYPAQPARARSALLRNGFALRPPRHGLSWHPRTEHR